MIRLTIFSGARTSKETDSQKYFPTQNSFKTHCDSRHLQKNVSGKSKNKIVSETQCKYRTSLHIKFQREKVSIGFSFVSFKAKGLCTTR